MVLIWIWIKLVPSSLQPNVSDMTIFFRPPTHWIDVLPFPLRNYTRHTPRQTPYTYACTTRAAEALDVERLNALFLPPASATRYRRTNGLPAAHKHISALFFFFLSRLLFSLFRVPVLFFLVYLSDFLRVRV